MNHQINIGIALLMQMCGLSGQHAPVAAVSAGRSKKLEVAMVQ